MYSFFRTAIGQDSHRFGGVDESTTSDGADGAARRERVGPSEPVRRRLVLGGVAFEGEHTLMGNSDADVVLHALCNAISGVTGVNIIGAVTDRMCLDEGVTDSAEYVKEALKYLASGKITHVSFSIECARPAISPKIPEMRARIAHILGVDIGGVCVTATSGEGLTDFGRGLGIQAFCVITVGYPGEPQ